jgi:hypothetical protein
LSASRLRESIGDCRLATFQISGKSFSLSRRERAGVRGTATQTISLQKKKAGGVPPAFLLLVGVRPLGRREMPPGV